MEYNVGEILWIVSNSPGIVVVRVIEEITKKTLSGTKTSYIVEVLGKEDSGYDLENIKGKIHRSKDDAVSTMMENTRKAIDSMVEQHVKLIANLWNAGEKIAGPPESASDNQISDDNYEVIELENGTKARIKVSNIKEKLG